MAKITNKYKNHFALFLCAALVFDALNCRCLSQTTTASKTQPRLQSQKNMDSFALFLMTSMQGYITPCGCSSNPLGGIARLSTLVREISSAFAGRVALIDGGDLLFDSLKREKVDYCQDEARVELLLNTLSSIGLAATIIGPYDEASGKNWVKDAYTKMNFSLTNQDNGILLDRQGILVGIIGYRLNNILQLEKIIFSVEAQIEKLQKKGAKAIVLLAQAPIRLTKKLAASIRYVDIIIQGHGPDEAPRLPEQVHPNSPWIVSAGMQGQFLGVIELNNLGKRAGGILAIDDRLARKQERKSLLLSRLLGLEKQYVSKKNKARKAFLKTRIAAFKEEVLLLEKQDFSQPLVGPHFVFKVLPIDKSIKPDPKVQASLKAYEAKVPELVKKCEENITCPQLKPGKAHFVGAESCKNCHAQAYKVWRNAKFIQEGKDESGKIIKRVVGHAKAWKTLVDLGKNSDRSCVDCHSVGFMRPGGYCKVSDVGELKNVQCESCHGPGSKHAKTGGKKLITRKVPEFKCRECHQVPHIESTKSFVYDEKVKKILGLGHGG